MKRQAIFWGAGVLFAIGVAALQPQRRVEAVEFTSDPIVAPATYEATPLARPPETDPSITAMKKTLLEEPKILDLLYQQPAALVNWQIGVRDDGTSRIGYAGYVCGRLREANLVDDDTDVRIVDVVKLNQTEGDFRASSLGHIRCKDEVDMGA